jgi:hypothetical protein
MISGSCKLLWISICLAAISFLWKHHCKVTFNEVSHPLFLEDLLSFKQELALLLRVYQHAFCRDVESFPVGAWMI